MTLNWHRRNHGGLAMTIITTLVPRFHSGSWWVWAPAYDSDTGPFATEREAKEWIAEVSHAQRAA